MPLGTAQDHKRIFDDDRGPNTGGMGAFAPSPLMTARLRRAVMRRIVEPVLEGMRREGEPLSGFCTSSLMLTPDGPKVIEFNVRFGDPEAQVVLPARGAVCAALLAAATGRLDARDASRERRTGSSASCSLARVSGDVPSRAALSTARSRGGDAERRWCFTRARAIEDGGHRHRRRTRADGRGPRRHLRDAMATAYRGASTQIHFDGMQFRRDIGRKALMRGLRT